MWEKGQFEINTVEGALLVDGVLSPPFGVHLSRQAWGITHLPSGMRIPFDFDEIGDATEAADAIRSVWNGADDPFPHIDDELWEPVKSRIMQVIKKYNAVYDQRHGPASPEIEFVRRGKYLPVNGYTSREETS